MYFRRLGLPITIGLLALPRIAVAAPGQEPSIERDWAVIERGDREVHTYLAQPEGGGQFAVVVIHENQGLTDWVIGVADRLAASGYIALAPDLLSGSAPDGGRSVNFSSANAARQAISSLPAEQITADLAAVALHAAGLTGSLQGVAVGGFCWGGSQTFAFATQQPDLAAAFVFYGTGPASADEVAAINYPVYGFYGSNDNRVTSTVANTAEAMESAGKFFEPVVYQGAGHGFMRSGEDAAAAQVNRDGHEQGWSRWLALLETHSLKATPSAVESMSWGKLKTD